MDNNIQISDARDGNEIVQIKVANLLHHPDNPRKNLGDVSELAESIKKNGVMQNLTVIPIDYNKPLEEQVAANMISVASDFYVLIGNRRLEAAKMAGIERVPCRIVSQIDKKKQVAIMLEENMQRNDLTVLEQAEGFQMMLDLGDTIEGIREKTGFSKTTIYHRLNIAKLDRDTLQEKEKDESFQLSIRDMNELERIKDIETRNKVLKKATDGRNLKYLIDDAVRSEERKWRAEKIIEILEGQGMSQAPEGAWDMLYVEYEPVKTFHLEEENCCENVQDVEEYDRTAEELMYFVCGYSLYIVKEREEEEEEEEEEEQISAEDMARAEREKNKRKISYIMEEMTDRKNEFIKSIVNGDVAPIEENASLYAEIWRRMLAMGTVVKKKAMYEFFARKPYWQLTEDEEKEAEKQADGLTVIQQMLLVMDDAASGGSLYDYNGTFDQDAAEKKKQIYEILKKFGWSFTQEEEGVLDGTHELYASKEE